MLTFAAKSNGLCGSVLEKGKSGLPDKAIDIYQPVTNNGASYLYAFFHMIHRNAVQVEHPAPA